MLVRPNTSSKDTSYVRMGDLDNGGRSEPSKSRTLDASLSKERHEHLGFSSVTVMGGSKTDPESFPIPPNGIGYSRQVNMT
jgi:hypothetical protein